MTERDLSQYTEEPNGTAVLVVGFASKGRDYEPMYLTSRSAWLTQYGEPTNEAERYFFNASMEVINQGGMLYCCKLPYKNDSLDKMTVKTYKVNPYDLKELMTVIDYIKSHDYMRELMEGDFASAGLKTIEQADNLNAFLNFKLIADRIFAYKTTIDNYTIGIPYAYALSDWLGSIDRPEVEDDNWMYVPVQFVYDKLSCLFDANSYFRTDGLVSARIRDSYITNVNLSAIENEVPRILGTSLNPETSANQLVSTFCLLFAEACGNDTDTEAFRNACDPSNPGTILSNILDEYSSFETSPMYKFLMDNEDFFTRLTAFDFNDDDEVFHGQKPYFYYFDDKFNVGAYYRAFTLYDTVVESQKIVNETNIIDIYNSLIDVLNFFHELAPNSTDASVLEDILRGAIEAVGEGNYESTEEPSDSNFYDNYKWTNTAESKAELTDRLVVTNKKSKLVSPLSKLCDALRKILNSSEYDRLRNIGRDGKFNNSPFVKIAVAYYLERTMVDVDDKIKLNQSKNFNDFYHTETEPLSSYFEKYNYPESASPELSSVDALVDATIETLSRKDFVEFVNSFIETPEFRLIEDQVHSDEDKYGYLIPTLEAFDEAKINAALRFSEIKRADPSIKTYMEIDSSPDVKLMDIDVIDGYATGETPVSQDSIVIVDKTRGTLGEAFAKNDAGYQKQVVGIIPIITTAANGLYAQALLETGETGIDDYNCVGTAETLFVADGTFKNKYVKFSLDDKDAALAWKSKFASDYTVSRYVGGTFPSMHFTDDGTFDRQEMKKIGLVVLRAYLDPGEGNKVNYDIVESFVGELDKDAIDPNTGATTFIDTLVNANSEYIEVYSNCFNTDGAKANYSKMDLFTITDQKAGDLGFYHGMVKKDISVADSITKPLQLIWEKNESIDEKQLDIVVDAGVSNIAQFIKSVYGEGIGEYDPISEHASLFKLRSKEDTKTWRDVIGMYDNFCKKIRKDCMFVADCPRPFCLQGNKKIVRTSKPKNTIDANILPMLKYITGLNTNYGAGYCDWFQIADEFSGDYFWCPPSIKAMGVYLNTDINFDYWMAPAGLNRGIIPALDVAFSPTQRQADEIYPKSWNYARSYPIEGIVLEGQRTFQSKDSALDRVAARRALLRFERICYQLARWFLYETNDVLTRQRFYDALNGAYAEIKARGGMYDYQIICDERVNGDNEIEKNIFRCKVGVKLNKFMEFIYVEFNILKRSASWEEML